MVGAVATVGATVGAVFAGLRALYEVAPANFQSKHSIVELAGRHAQARRQGVQLAQSSLSSN